MRLRENARSKSGSTVAQKWRVARLGSNRNIPALDAASLERLALRYVERYATTRAKLSSYLLRKLNERGWEGDSAPPIEAIVSRFAELRYVDDRQFAEIKAASLTRRGYGRRRVDLALKVAGIEVEDAAPVLDEVDASARDAALAFARRKRIGPFAQGEATPETRRRAFAAMMRAGHPVDIVRSILSEPFDSVDFA